MPITTPPTAPSRTDPTTFPDRADAWVAWQETSLVPQINALEANVNAREASTVAASSAAAAVVNATLWVSGTSYTLGQAVFDPVNFLTYRRAVAGAGTTRPGLDAVNWLQVAGTGDVSTTGNQTIGGTKTFSNPIVGSTNTQVSLTGNQTIGGIKTFTGRIHLTGDPAAVGTAGSTGILEVGDSSGNTPATMSFHKQGFAINMGLDTDNVFRLGGWSQGLNVHRWTSDTSGNFTALGNITAGGQFIGNGAGLTNVPASAIAGALNAPGSAPIYACRAWVNFNGTGTVAIRASGNVSSITDNGVGDYTLNFATALPDANYSANISATAPINGNHVVPFIADSAVPGVTLLYSTTQLRIIHISAANSAARADPAVVNVAIFR